MAKEGKESMVLGLIIIGLGIVGLVRSMNSDDTLFITVRVMFIIIGAIIVYSALKNIRKNSSEEVDANALFCPECLSQYHESDEFCKRCGKKFQ